EERRVHIVPVAHEALVGGAVDVDVEVAGAAAARRVLPLARQAQALSVVDARRDVDGERLGLGRDARAAAVLALVLDDRPLAAAARADGADHEEALLVDDLAAAAARRTAIGTRARRRARSRAARARHAPAELDLLGASRHGLGEREPHVEADVTPAPRAAPPAPPAAP